MQKVTDTDITETATVKYLDLLKYSKVFEYTIKLPVCEYRILLCTVLVSVDGTPLLGLHSQNTYTIWLDVAVPKRKFVVTAWHELAHAISVQFNFKLSEEQCDQVAMIISTLLDVTGIASIDKQYEHFLGGYDASEMRIVQAVDSE